MSYAGFRPVADGLFGIGLWQGLLAALIVGLAVAGAKVIGPRVRLRMGALPAEVLLSLIIHLRDVARAASHGVPKGRAVDEHIHRVVLEPVTTLLPRRRGELIKIVWFVPEPDGSLIARDQVGYTNEQQKLIRLGRGYGIAGRAFNENVLVAIPDTTQEPEYVPIKGVDDQGALICVPIADPTDWERATGVLSVLSTRKNSLKPAHQDYLRCLAAMIAVIETPPDAPTVMSSTPTQRP